MFENDFMEFFSHIHPATPLIIYLPVISWMFYLSITRGIPLLGIAGLFLLGVFIWTFVEYTLHRFFFHYEPKSDWGKRFHFIMHGVHHDYPQDATRLVMAPSVSIPLALLFYGIFILIFGSYAPPVFAGMVFGYVCYDMIHYATHHFAMKKGILLWLKQYHMRHHYRDDNTGYGVSTPLWDYVFRTEQKD
jgi:sterol desaturase/sphingolipid hydroxylase (fatty acid hydroxylase superfamily)